MNSKKKKKYQSSIHKRLTSIKKIPNLSLKDDKKKVSFTPKIVQRKKQ